MQPAVWIVGNWRHTDFSAPIAWLQRTACCATFDDSAAACGTLRASRLSNEPTAILFAESHPGEICATDAERLLAALPLARVAVLFGPWCEGPQRKGRNLPGVARVNWSCWQSRLARELGLTDRAGPPLPRTMTETERIERGHLSLESPHSQRGRVAICTSSRARFQALADTTARLGFTSIWQAAHPPSHAQTHDIAIYDGWEQVSDEGDSLVEAGASSSPKRMLLLSFPRPEDFARAAGLGMDAVVAQPMLLSDFAGGLSRLMPERSAAAEIANGSGVAPFAEGRFAPG